VSSTATSPFVSTTLIHGPDVKNVKKNSFVPTHEWALEWKSKLPLEAVYRLLDFFLPRIDSLAQTKVSTPSEGDILSMIQSTTLVGVLPVPHSIIVRRYIANTYTNLWFTTNIWGIIFLRNQTYPLFDSEKIQLFSIFVQSDDEQNFD